MSSREDILKIDETLPEEEVQFHEEDQTFGSSKSKDSDGFDKLPEDDDVDPEGSKVPNPRTSSSSGARTGPTASKTVTFMPDKPTMCWNYGWNQLRMSVFSRIGLQYQSTKQLNYEMKI